jgi:hypothetical protein
LWIRSNSESEKTSGYERITYTVHEAAIT